MSSSAPKIQIPNDELTLAIPDDLTLKKDLVPPPSSLPPLPTKLRRIPNITAAVAELLCAQGTDGEDIASELDKSGFRVIPLGGVGEQTLMHASPEAVDAHVASNITPVGGHLIRVVEVAGGLRATCTFPLGDDGKDRSKIAAVKEWQNLPFAIEHWNRGATVPLPPGWRNWGTVRKTGKPILQRRGDPRRNVGICTGDGLLVIDVDRKNGLDGLEALQEEFGDQFLDLFPETLTVTTPSGGLHWYYDYPNALTIKNSASALARGVDVRADGGYVVAPGSIALNGKRYLVSKCQTIADAPKGLLDLLTVRSKKTTAVCKSNVVPMHAMITREEALAQVLAKHPTVSSGTRHATLVSVGGTLRNLLDDLTDLEWAYRAFATERGLDDRDLEDLEQVLADALKFERRAAPVCGGAPDTPAVASKTKIALSYDQAAVIRELEQAAASVDWVYQRSGAVVEIIRSKIARQPSISAIATESFAPLTTDFVSWIKRGLDKDGIEVETPVVPPISIVKGLLTSPRLWTHIRELHGVVEYPVLRPDGTVCATPGYDPALCLFVVDNFAGVVVPDAPTHDDAVKACAEVLDLIVDFPFAGEVDKAVFIAALLTPLVRFADVENVPLILIDKNIRGSGGSLLVDTIATVLKGRKFPRVPQSGNDEETRKSLTSWLLGGDDVVMLDNLAHPLGGPHLDAILTGSEWRDRLLGGNSVPTLRTNLTIYATGNNVEVLGDTGRRCLRLRLDSDHENPEERTDFKYPQLLAHVRANRARLLSAALTILRAFCVAGRPHDGLGKPWGSFEAWWSLVAGAVSWVGLPDPAMARVSVDASSDTARTELGELIDAWHEVDPSSIGVTAKQILTLIANDPQGQVTANIRSIFTLQSGRIMGVREVAAKLHKLRKRVVAGHRLVATTNRTNTNVWRVESVSCTSPSSSPKPSTTPTEALAPPMNPWTTPGSAVIAAGVSGTASVVATPVAAAKADSPINGVAVSLVLNANDLID